MATLQNANTSRGRTAWGLKQNLALNWTCVQSAWEFHAWEDFLLRRGKEEDWQKVQLQSFLDYFTSFSFTLENKVSKCSNFVLYILLKIDSLDCYRQPDLSEKEAWGNWGHYACAPTFSHRIFISCCQWRSSSCKTQHTLRLSHYTFKTHSDMKCVNHKQLFQKLAHLSFRSTQH